MADRPWGDRRVLLSVLAAAAVLAILTVARGPVALLAAATLAVMTGAVMALPPLLRHDGIDWRWSPGRDDELPPEPGIATLRRLLTSTRTDATAAAELQDLIRAIAEDRSPDGPGGTGPLAAYLAGPPRPLDLDEVEALVTELETLSLTPKETS